MSARKPKAQDLATGDLTPGVSHWTEAKARASWAVGVLDSWAARNSGFAFKTDTDPNDCAAEEPWVCGVAMSRLHRSLARRGVSPDAARIAVAEALVEQDPSLASAVAALEAKAVFA